MKKTLMVSISGIRGVFGEGLDPAVLVKYTAAYGTWCRRRAAAAGREAVVLVGREQWIRILFGAEYLPCTLAVACRLRGGRMEQRAAGGGGN